jgi:glyoxylase-like metal-dependent hydrolase (beta-lactamase superfamily II)
LHLAFRGRAHTAGDVVVYCPQAKVVAAGDMLNSTAPFLSDGYPLEWNRTLLSVAEFDFAHVIPGHGGVQHTRERLYELGSFIVEMTEAVVQGKRKGKTIAEIQQETTPEKLVTLQRYGYGTFLTDSLRRYTLRPPSQHADPLPKTVATCLAQIDSALERKS